MAKFSGKIRPLEASDKDAWLPLWRGSPDNVVGVLHAKELWRALHAAHGDVAKLDITALTKPPWYVPDTMPLACVSHAAIGEALSSSVLWPDFAAPITPDNCTV